MVMWANLVSFDLPKRLLYIRVYVCTYLFLQIFLSDDIHATNVACHSVNTFV